MTMLEQLLAQPIAQDLGWTLLHFVWQGALIAILFGIAMSLSRWKSAAIRYAFACGALLLMAAAPVVTLARLRAVPSAASEAHAAAAPAALDSIRARAAVTQVSSAVSPRRLAFWLQTRFPALQPWMVLAWSLGVAVLSVRYLGGWAAAQRLKGRRTRPAANGWQSTLDRLAARLRVSRPVRLLESAWVKVPTAIGVWKPVVLVPAAALTGIAPSHLEALLAHELAHIRRHDYLVNLLQSAVETLLFYHPAVWWVSRRARVERENCCDDLAILATGNARLFARALADLEERRAGAFRLQTAADGGVLRQRVLRLIGKPERSDPLPRQLAAVFTLALLFGTGAAVRFSSPQIDGAPTPAFSALSAYDSSEDGTGLTNGDPEDVCTDCESEVSTARKAAVKSGVEGGVAGGVEGGVRGGVAGGVAAGIEGGIPGGVVGGIVRSITSSVSSSIAESVAQTSYDAVVVALAQEAQDETKPQAAPKKGAEPGRGAALSVEQLIAFKVHGVTPEFIREIETLGHGRPSPDDLIALRIHGVTPEYVRSVERTWGRLSLEQVVSMKIHGLTPEYAAEMKGTGLKGLSFDELMSMKIHGITPEYIKQAQASGFGALDADQIVSLKIHGVSAQDVEKWKALGMRGVDFDQVVSAKIHGVTPQFVEEMRKLGFTKLDLDDLVGMKIHGVTPEFVGKLRELGYNVSPDDVTALRIHGVTVDAVRDYKSAEPKLTLEDMVQLKIHGIRPTELKKMLRDGKLSVDDLLEDEEDPEDEP